MSLTVHVILRQLTSHKNVLILTFIGAEITGGREQILPHFPGRNSEPHSRGALSETRYSELSPIGAPLIWISTWPLEVKRLTGQAFFIRRLVTILLLFYRVWAKSKSSQFSPLPLLNSERQTIRCLAKCSSIWLQDWYAIALYVREIGVNASSDFLLIRSKA